MASVKPKSQLENWELPWGMLEELPSHGSKWVAFSDAPLMANAEEDINATLAPLAPRALWSPNWNGSFHEALYTPKMVAWGRTPCRAKKALNRALKALEVLISEGILKRRDSAEVRFEARRAVREGD